MEKYSIFHIEGGLGKHVAATAVARSIKSNHIDRKLIVVCAYPEVFLNLDYVDRVYRIGSTPYFYDDYIKNKDSIIFKHEPYFTTDHIHKKKSLIENWISLYGLEYKGELPQLEFNVRQEQWGYKKWNRDRPIMVIQTNGGPLKDQPYMYSWTRDMPIQVSKPIVDQYSNDYHIIQICRDVSQKVEGVSECIFDPMTNMELFSLLIFSSKEVLIDSSLQHASAALKKSSSTVLWIATSPEIFGYSTNKNIVAQLPDMRLPDSYLFDYNFNGSLHECPIKDLINLFDINEIIETIKL